MPRRAVIYFYYLKMGSLIAFPLQGFSAWPIASAKKKKKTPNPLSFTLHKELFANARRIGYPSAALHSWWWRWGRRWSGGRMNGLIRGLCTVISPQAANRALAWLSVPRARLSEVGGALNEPGDGCGGRSAEPQRANRNQQVYALVRGFCACVPSVWPLQKVEGLSAD